MLSDPGRTSTPDHCGASVLSPLSQTRRLPLSSFFRGSFTRLCSSLPTLEGVISDSPTKARFRWWVRPFRTGRFPPGLDRGFLLLVLSFLLSVLCFCFEHHPRLSGLWLAPRDWKWVKRGTGDWKGARTRRLESLRYVAQTFLSAGSGDIPVPSSCANNRPLPITPNLRRIAPAALTATGT